MNQLSVSFCQSTETQEYVFLGKRLTNSKFSVFHCTVPSRKASYALKVYPKDSASRIHYNREKQILSKLTHPNVIQYAPIFGHTSSYEFDILITKYAPYGNLMGLHKVFLGQEKLVRTYFRQMIEGLEYIHSKGIAHLDLKPENLLIDEDFVLKIADFDLSQSVGEKSLISGGTIDFRAPEIIERDCRNFYPADLYSAGVILYFLLTGESPFLEAIVDEEFTMVHYDIFENKNWDFWKLKAEKMRNIISFSGDLKALINGMLRKDAILRYNIKEIKDSKWFNGPYYEKEQVGNEMTKIFDQILMFSSSKNDYSFKYRLV